MWIDKGALQAAKKAYWTYTEGDQMLAAIEAYEAAKSSEQLVGLPPIEAYKDAQSVANEIMDIIRTVPEPYACIISCLAHALPIKRESGEYPNIYADTDILLEIDRLIEGKPGGKENVNMVLKSIRNRIVNMYTGYDQAVGQLNRCRAVNSRLLSQIEGDQS